MKSGCLEIIFGEVWVELNFFSWFYISRSGSYIWPVWSKISGEVGYILIVKSYFRCYLWKTFGYIRKSTVFCISQWKSKNAKKGSCFGVTCSTYASDMEELIERQGPLCPKDQESSPFVYTYLQPVKRYSRKTSKKSIFFVAFLADFGQIAKVFVRFWKKFWPL